MNCARCNKIAVIDVGYTKESLCKNCFLGLFEDRVKKNIRVNQLLHPKDKTVVAVSGGKDSAVALYILHKLHKKAPKSELVALTIDQGIKEYGNQTLSAAKKLCNHLEVEHHIFSFKKEFGVSLDELVEKTKKLKKPAPVCSYCGVLRRRLLNDKARELGATKIAIGHNMDDEIQVSLMNYIRGDISRIARMGPVVGIVKDTGFVSRIKPLRRCPEDEVLLYAKLKDIVFEQGRCPYSGNAFRKTIREAIDLIDRKHPGSRFQILNSTDQLIPMIRSSLEVDTLKKCVVCGEITSGELCRLCQIKKELGLK